MIRKTLFILLAAVLSLAATSPGMAQEPLKIGILPIVEALPFILMEKEGKPENLEIVVFSSALERDAALQGGQIDGGITDPLASAIMAGRGMDVVLASLILGSDPTEGRFAIVAAPGSSIKTPQDLKGVPIAISSNTIIEYVTDSLLTEAGLKESEIAKEEIRKMPVRFQMLMSGQVQAATLPDPLAHFALSKGAKLITFQLPHSEFRLPQSPMNLAAIFFITSLVQAKIVMILASRQARTMGHFSKIAKSPHKSSERLATRFNISVAQYLAMEVSAMISFFSM